MPKRLKISHEKFIHKIINYALLITEV